MAMATGEDVEKRMKREKDAIRVGFVGLGNMGWPMARNLARAGFPLTVRDTDESRQEAFAVEHGCSAAGSPEDFALVDVVITMLPDDRVVHEAVVGWGIAAALEPGAVVVDMSSSRPTGTRALGEQLAATQVGLVDAPVSGGVPRAESATLAIMVGGDDETAIDRVLPILGALGERIFRTGGSGSGHAMKALNNYVAASAYTAAVEALVVGQEFGLDPQTMIEVINASTGRSFATEQVVAEHVLTERYATGFALGLLAKDVGIAADMVEVTGVEAPLCELVGRRWAEALEELGFSADHSEAHKGWWSTGFDAPPDARPEHAGVSPPVGT